MKQLKLFGIALLASVLFWQVGYSQLPTVYFNKVFNATNPSGNSVSITTQLSGTNFKFIGDEAGSSGTFVNGSYVPGKLIYITTDGANVVYIGKINLRDADGSTIYGFLFEQTSGGSAKFYVTNPAYDDSRTGNATYTLNSGNVNDKLNTMRNSQVVLLANFFVSDFSTCLNTASTSQTFTISGQRMVADATVTAPTNFEVSKDDITYASSVSYTPTSQTLSSSTVYVRLKSNASTGSYSGNLIVSTTNAASQTLTVTGTVNTTTAISSHPSASTACSGVSSTFSVSATGASLTYQWQVSSNGGSSFTDLSNTGIYTGSTTSVLRLSSGTTTDYNAYRYRCVITGSCGSSVTSNDATLTVNSSVSISSAPSNASICAADNTSFSVTASGTSLSYQWQVSTNGGSSFSNISNSSPYSGATTSTLSITNASSSLATYQYRCALSGTCSSENTSAATLTINSAPSTPTAITGNSSICNNTEQAYSTATVSGATAYAWVLPSGWTGSSTTNSINVVNSSTSDSIKVLASNACGNSSYRTLYVAVTGTAAPTPAFTINNQEQCLSSNSFTFTNESTPSNGTTIASYAWDFGDNSGTSSSTNPTYTYLTTGSFNVYMTTTASNGCITSISKTVVVNGAPTSSLSGSATICSGSSATLTVSLTGEGPWVLNYTDASSTISVSSSSYSFTVTPSSTTTFTISSLSDSKCAASGGNMTGSAVVTVNANATPAVTISSSDADNSICSNTTVTFSASGQSNQGSSPAYQWLNNGVNVNGQTSSSYSTSGLANGDVISLQMISNSSDCLATNSVISNTIQTVVQPGAPDSPLAISGDTTQCTSLSNQEYYIASVLNATTYTWALPSGWTVNSGSGTTTVSVSLGSSASSGSVTVTAGNGCGTSSEQILPVAVSSSSSNPISLTSSVNTDAQTLCINNAITNITYSSSGGTSASFSSLPTGVSGSYSSGTISISGTPTVAGTYSYTITLTGGGCNYTKTGSIIVSAANTISLSSASATTSQTVCVSTALTNITYSTSGATGASFSGLPAGVTGSFSSNTVTISGSPSSSGSYSYTVTLTGGCATVTSSGSITVTATKTITLTSGASSSAQSICINSSLGTLTYGSTGGSGAVFSGLPTGISGSYSGGVSTLSGSPSVSGTYSYTVALTGGCGSASQSGTITVSSTYPTASISSNGGSICAGFDATFTLSGTSNSVVTYSINSGSSSTVTLSNGNNNNGTITVSGATANQQLSLTSVQETTYGCSKNLSSTSTVAIKSDDEWTAKGNSDVFHTAANWCKNGVPGSASNILIPVIGNGTYPKLTGQDEEVANVEINSGAKINLNGRKLTINGTVSGTGQLSGSSSSTVEFNGSSGMGTLYMDPTDATTKTIGTLKVNRSGETLTLGNDATVNNLDLTAGKVDIGTNELTIGTATSNASTSSYIKVSGIGKVKKNIANGASFTFPVGKTSYNPITITNNNSSADDFTLNVVDEVYASYDGNGVGTTAMTGPRVTRTWNIGKATSSNSGGLTLQFNWNTGEATAGLNTPVLYHFESGNWVKQSGLSSSGSNTFTFNSYTGSFSPFAIGDDNTNLPVLWQSFAATKLNDKVLLNWVTASEQHAKDFEIQHSLNTIEWNSIGNIPAAGNSTTPKNYSYIHSTPRKNNWYNYYRILQRDLDGKSSFSKIVSIVFNEPGHEVMVYPIPAVNELTVYLAEPQIVKLYNVAGSLVWQGKLPAGINHLPVGRFSRGVYILSTLTQRTRVIFR